MEKVSFSTHSQCEMIDITDELTAFLARNVNRNWKNGFICVFSPHTTCGVTINEGYDPDVRDNINDFLTSLIPADWGFQHTEGNSDAHIKTSLVGLHCLVPVEDGRLALGKWQAAYLCEFDGPRLRTLNLSFLPAE